MVAKRAAENISAASPVGKKRKQNTDPNTKLLHNVLDGIKAADVPSMIRDLLVEALPLSLGVNKEERHRFQAEVVEMVGNVLTTQDASFLETVNKVLAKIDEAEHEKSTKEVDLKAVEAALEAKNSETQTAKYSLADYASIHKAAKGAVAAAQIAQEEAADTYKEATTKKTLLETAFREQGQPLTEAGVEEDQRNAIVNTLMATLSKFDFDTSMLTALPTALKKPPSARGEFDELVVTQFKEEVRMRVEALEETLQSGDAVARERIAALEVAERECTKALEVLKSKAQSFKQAESAREACHSSIVEAKNDLNRRTSELRKRARERDSAQAELELFRDGPLAAFEKLREFTGPAKDISSEVGAQEVAA